MAEGRVYLYLGNAAGVSTSAAWTAEGNVANARFGISVAGAGDVNADGFADVIIGGQNFSNGQSSEGKVWVYLGTSSGLAAAPLWTQESNQAFACLGNSVAGAGDVNGDGLDDIVFGALQFDNGQVDEGRAVIVW